MDIVFVYLCVAEMEVLVFVWPVYSENVGKRFYVCANVEMDKMKDGSTLSWTVVEVGPHYGGGL